MQRIVVSKELLRLSLRLFHGLNFKVESASGFEIILLQPHREIPCSGVLRLKLGDGQNLAIP